MSKGGGKRREEFQVIVKRPLWSRTAPSFQRLALLRSFDDDDEDEVDDEELLGESILIT